MTIKMLIYSEHHTIERTGGRDIREYHQRENDRHAKSGRRAKIEIDRKCIG